MAAGNLGKVDPEVAFGMAADEQDGTVHGNRRGDALIGGDELVIHSATFSEARNSGAGKGTAPLIGFSSGSCTMTLI